MSVLEWDKVGERRFENGVDHGVLYIQDDTGAYTDGFAWNGLTAVTESPSGAEATKQYADNIPYLTLVSIEEFGGTIEAYTYPPEFGQCDGTAEPSPGVLVGQQSRKTFGLCYRTKVGNDLNPDAGYKLHLVYGALAAPSEKAYATINDSPEAATFSWEITTYPVAIAPIGGVTYKPAASLTIDSTKVDADTLAILEGMLYGTVGSDPTLPTPFDVISLFEGTVTLVTPTVPTYVDATDTLTIPTQAGVVYKINGVVQTPGDHVLTADALVVASPTTGYAFNPGVDNDWFFNQTP